MPPKKNKSGGKNGFYQFMVEFKARQGNSFKSMNEVAIAAGPHWQNMSKEQRRPYELRAQMQKNNMAATKYTSDGKDIGLIEKEEREEQRRIEEMKEEINQELKMAGRTGRIQDKMFFLIHVNTFCYNAAENRYYPAEIGVAGFTLEFGVLPENVFHRILNPGFLPLGFASVAKLHSKETHQIEPPIGDTVEHNLEEVFTELKAFLQSKMEGSKRMPILYCNEENVKMVSQILNTWSMDYDEGRTTFKVYNLQYMFRILRNTVAGDVVWSSDTFSVREIEKDVNAYAKGICCEYHDQTNVPIYCSRSVAVRHAFTICDNCCPDLNIPFVLGCHVPNTALTTTYSRPSSAASVSSFHSLGSSKMRSSVRDDDSESVISFSSKSDWEDQSVTSETSSSHAIHDEEDFPSLGRGRRREMSSPGSWNHFSPNDASSLFSQASSRSYAGAMGTSGLSRKPAEMSSSVMNSMEKLCLSNSSKSSDTISAGHGTSRSAVDDFPALPLRGRGVMTSRGRGLRRPNNQ